MCHRRHFFTTAAPAAVGFGVVGPAVVGAVVVGTAVFDLFADVLAVFNLVFVGLAASGSISSFWDRPGRKAKGSLQRTAISQTTDGQRTLYGPRHYLSRSHVSNE